MPRFLPLLALIALGACRAEFEPNPIGPGTPPPPPPPPAATLPFRIGSIQPDEGRAIVAGNFGDVLVASWFSAPTDFDPSAAATIRPGFGQQDLAVASYTAEGVFRWVTTLGGPGADIPFAMVATPDGGALVTGHSAGGGTCAGRTLVGLGGRDILLMKVSSDGACEWAQLLGGPEDDEGRALVLETGGTFVTAGLFRGTVDFDAGPGARLLVSRGGSDAFLARLSVATGALVDVVQGGGQGEEAFTAVTRAAAGELTVGGTFTGQASYGSGLAPVVLQAQGPADAMLARFTPLLGLRHAVALSSTGNATVAALLDEPDGSVVAAGTFSGVLDADPGPSGVLLQSEGSTDVFVARYAGMTGVYAGMARRVGGLGDDAATGLARSPDGALHLSGYFQGTVDFDPGPGATLVTARGTAGGGDAFLLTLGSLGTFEWVTPIGSATSGPDALAIGWGVTRGPGGRVWITGRFSGRADFDPGTGAVELQSLGATDQFVAWYQATTGALGRP